MSDWRNTRSLATEGGFPVSCPLHGGALRTVYIRFARPDLNTEWIPLSCSGCDHSNGSHICEDCQRAVLMQAYDDWKQRQPLQP